MHIKTPQSALLSNHEVLLHLREQEAEYNGTDGTGRARTKPAGFKNALQDTITYLTFHDSNHALASFADAHPNRPMTLYKGPNSLFRALAPHYRLNKAEFVQIYNLKPTTQVELQLIIEESHTRFTEADLDSVLSIIAATVQEPESSIPPGVETLQMEKIANKLQGASKKRRRGVAKKA
ncbi:hypothetical protein M011DRAFT_466702 [Sporormia fimetaria CBS 119925]|uniref:DNA-directed RNA polymerase III subunit RPC9 n=1 Tax=Sporormia fimetaria CBS 119925 TaxID=1340428 RepID=A0A6A6VER0_9PLEO|nr:hypothetical protein M011DRAFT_466702 [Sporormia fimetaria CBS 119925]